MQILWRKQWLRKGKKIEVSRVNGGEHQVLGYILLTLFSSDSEQKPCLNSRENVRGLPNWHPLDGNRVKESINKRILTNMKYLSV